MFYKEELKEDIDVLKRVIKVTRKKSDKEVLEKLLKVLEKLYASIVNCNI